MIINPIYVGFIVVPPFNLHFVFWYSFFPFFSFSLFILARGSSNLRSLLCIFKVRFSTVNPVFVFHLLLSLFLLLVVQGFLYSTFKNLLDLNAQVLLKIPSVSSYRCLRSQHPRSPHTQWVRRLQSIHGMLTFLDFFFIIFCYY